MNALKVIVSPIMDEEPGIWRPYAEKSNIMSAQQAEITINDAFSSASGQVSFLFYGPEPLLAGKDFFQMFLNLEKELLRPGQEAANIVCTCGDYLDESWVTFFAENGVETRIVVDGMWDQPFAGGNCPSWDHSWKTAEKAAELLKARGLGTGVVCCVTSCASRRAQGIYGILKKIGFDYCRFIPCTQSGSEKNGPAHWALTPAQYELFLKTLFDRWYGDCETGFGVDIRPFGDYVSILAGLRRGADLRGGLPLECTSCRWVKLCAQRPVKYPERDNADFFCGTYKWFFEYAEKRLEKLAAQEKKLRWS